MPTTSGSLNLMSERLTLLTVHAHPDDESSKGAATVHHYARQGVRCVLVCCTGGEEGDILNPAMDRPEVRENLHQIRMDELARATEIIGYHEVVMLGYRDSGMAESPARPTRTLSASPEPTRLRRSVAWWRSSGASGRR
jgi:mycothiol S-conjugate amidase